MGRERVLRAIGYFSRSTRTATSLYIRIGVLKFGCIVDCFQDAAKVIAGTADANAQIKQNRIVNTAGRCENMHAGHQNTIADVQIRILQRHGVWNRLN